ncbi:MAG: hypothetical protein LBK99_16300, partial [Opitutaceae bacterium]|nr:hypothetical protein [Opitutaceae bacterium]
MNDNDLKKHLSALAPPAPGEAARESARHAALAALADSAVPATPAAPASDVGGFGHTVATAGRRRSRPHGIRALFPAVAAFAAALAAALAILAVFFWRPTAGEGPVVTGVRSDSGDAATPLPADDAREMLAQVATLFPGQLNAVIERNGSVQIDVSAPPPPPPPGGGGGAGGGPPGATPP